MSGPKPIPCGDPEPRPSFWGKYRGKVLNNSDPEFLGRIMVEVPEVPGSLLNYAMPCVPYAGFNVGFYAIPPIDASVWVEFEGGDPNYPVWVGCFWAPEDVLRVPEPPPPEIKVFQTEYISMVLNDLPEIGGFSLKCSLPAVDVPLTMTFDAKGITLLCPESTISMTPGSITLTIPEAAITMDPENISITVPEAVITMTAETLTLAVPASSITLAAEAIEIEAPDLNITAITSIEGETNITPTLTIEGDANVAGLLTSEGDCNVAGILSSEGDLNVGGLLSAEGAVNIAGGVAIEGGGVIDGAPII
jgi:hypothetical protein